MADKLVEMGRLAFREEGEYWNAYFARQETMDDAILIGSIRMSVALRHRDIKKQFMNLMLATFDEVCQEVVGRKPEWRDPVTAPEHERTRE